MLHGDLRYGRRQFRVRCELDGFTRRRESVESVHRVCDRQISPGRRLAERGFADHRVTPHGVHQFLPRHEAIAVGDQVIEPTLDWRLEDTACWDLAGQKLKAVETITTYYPTPAPGEFFGIAEPEGVLDVTIKTKY